MRSILNPTSLLLVALFLMARLFTFAALPLEGLLGYGDFIHFFQLAKLGRPFLDYWSEFPPVFPFLSAWIFRLVGGQEHVYDYCLALLLSLAEAGSLVVFLRLVERIHGKDNGIKRGWIYLVFLLGTAYGYWYFDPLAVFFMLLGLAFIFSDHDVWSGMSLAMGTLTKLFPGLALVAAWHYRPAGKALLSSIIAMGLTAAVYIGLYVASPSLTTASLVSQAHKGSWETVWALLDGNLHTGNFGPEIERLDPATAILPRGNPTQIPSWLTLVLIGGLGAALFFHVKPPIDNLHRMQTSVAFLGLTWCLFLSWSPGYSPQWVLYLLPLILLVLPEREAILMGVTFVLVNLLEWPVLLSRGYFWGLWLTIPLRSLLLVLFGIEFWNKAKSSGVSGRVTEIIRNFVK